MVAERIRKGVEAISLKVGGKTLSITISIGCRLIDPKFETGALILIGDADKALYDSKSNGRNQTTIYTNGLLDKANISRQFQNSESFEIATEDSRFLQK